MSTGAPIAGTERLQLKIGGMSCSFCVASITKALGRMEGVREASVNLAHEEALITYDPVRVGPAQLKETLLDLGYTVRDADKLRTFEEDEAELEREGRNLLLAAGFTAMALAVARHTHPSPPMAISGRGSFMSECHTSSYRTSPTMPKSM